MNLDDLEVYPRLDPSGMREHIHALPGQCRTAWQRAMEFDLPPAYSEVDNVVILGMGGSAIGGDFVGTLAGTVPIWVCRDYDLPPLVDGKTLVIASSYSGDTEETVSAFTDALKSSCQKLILTGGGRLGELGVAGGIPTLEIDYQAPPRAVFGYSFISLLGVLSRVGILPDKSGEVGEMVRLLDKLSAEVGERVPSNINMAKQLATELYGRLVVIYGAGILSDVARRWKTQLNENSKAWAFFELFPELNHNSVVGYEFPLEIRERIFVVLLRSRAIHPRILVRYGITEEMLDEMGIQHRSVGARGEDALSQMMSLVLFGDWVSYYLAILNEVDPSEVKAIDYIKTRLSEP